MPIIETFEQYSEEWFKAKAGKPSASDFDRIITSKGKPSDQQTDYIDQLTGEAILKKRPEESYSNYWMNRGLELEPQARLLFQIMTGIEIEECGLIQNDSKTICCSPDGINKKLKIGLEIKCKSLKVHTKYFKSGLLPLSFKQQIQSSLMVSGYKLWYFMAYYPDLFPMIIKCGRDEPYIKLMQIESDIFLKKLKASIKIYKQREKEYASH